MIKEKEIIKKLQNKEELSYYEIEQCSKEKANAFYVRGDWYFLLSEGSYWYNADNKMNNFYKALGLPYLEVPTFEDPREAIYPIYRDEDIKCYDIKIYLKFRIKDKYKYLV